MKIAEITEKLMRMFVDEMIIDMGVDFLSLF